MRLKKIWFVASILILIILLIIWGVNFYFTNANAIKPNEEVYFCGEQVALDGNFFFDSIENTNGYSICVNYAELVDYRELVKSTGNDVQLLEEMYTPKYICLLNVTVKNEGNSEGYLLATAFYLFNKSLKIPIDFQVWNMIDEAIDGKSVLKLRENTEVTLTIPFSAQYLDEAINSQKLNKRLENESFYFCFCSCPVKKLIEFKFNK